jgi:NAD(P)-dependent dehydrogenase (short-subunit alcohol dehydrogenase family)
VVIANAGFPDGRLVGELDRAGLDHSHDVIVGGFFELVTEALPHLRQATDPRVLAVSSLVAHVFRPDYPLHPASAVAKAGLEAMVRSLAVQLGPLGITCNAVAPGLTSKDHGKTQAHAGRTERTILEQIPLARKGRPDEIAALIGFLAGPRSSYITGQVIHANGGIC